MKDPTIERLTESAIYPEMAIGTEYELTSVVYADEDDEVIYQCLVGGKVLSILETGSFHKLFKIRGSVEHLVEEV